MFTAFFYLCRERGLHISVHEWVSLLEGCQKGLHRNSLNGFYQLCRTVLIKSETEYDRFDLVFSEFFEGVPFREELPDELLEWLNAPTEDLKRSLEELKALHLPDEALEEILRMLQERLQEQTEEHNGGSYWVGTQGRSLFGNNGWRPGGIRVGGRSLHHAAAMVAGERRYRDFRKDGTLDSRQFQMAFRALRQISAQTDAARRELDVDGTVRDTCDQAGMLRLRYARPRKNAVKVLLMMDSGGSMEPHAALCSRLFQAARKANHFQELQTLFFHNCVYGYLYKDPGLRAGRSLPTEWVLQNLDASWRVIFVGDAAMAPEELRSAHFNWDTMSYEPAGIAWLELFRRQFPYTVWLNPEPLPAYKNYWTQTHLLLAELFPMYDLSVEGLEKGIRRLMVKR